MPTYDYACPKCGTTQEVYHGMNEAPRVRCPKCRSLTRKQIGAGAGLLFRGSGFYETDYRSSSYHASAKAEQTPAAPSAPAAKDAAGTKTKAGPVTADAGKV